MDQSDPTVIKKIADGKAKEEQFGVEFQSYVRPRTYHVVLKLNTEPAEYPLEVASGDGFGRYPPDSKVTISARAAPEGKVFEKWVGDTENLESVTARSTTLRMPAAVNIRASYVTVAAEPEAVSIGKSDTAKQ